jgi:sulfonate transport system substrate-binding protein
MQSPAQFPDSPHDPRRRLMLAAAAASLLPAAVRAADADTVRIGFQKSARSS